MEIIKLKEADKKQIRSEWETRGASLNKLATLDVEFASNNKWFAVTDENKTEAIFNIRQTPICLKNMEVIFAPDIDFNSDELDYKAVKQIIVQTVNILALIFSYHLNDLAEGNNKLNKIYSDHKELRLIFYKFCEHLEKEDPEKYEFKTYGKWIEIHSAI